MNMTFSVICQDGLPTCTNFKEVEQYFDIWFGLNKIQRSVMHYQITKFCGPYQFWA